MTRCGWSLPIAVSLMLATAGAAAAPAAYSSSVKVKSVPIAGPVLAGDRVVWARREGDVARVLSASKGRPVRTVARFAPLHRNPLGPDIVVIELAASDRRLAVNVRQNFVNSGKQPDEPTLSQPYSGVLGAALNPLAAQCPFQTVGGFSLGEVAVSGDVVAFRGEGCTITVRDLANPSAPPLTFGAEAVTPRVAGRFVAVLNAPTPYDRYGDFAVHDRLTRQRLYRIVAPRASSLSIDSEGSVVVGQLLRGPGVPLRMRLARASPQDPVLRPLRAVTGYVAARAAGGKIVAVRQPRSVTTIVSKGRLELVEPASGRDRLLAAPVDDELYRPHFDFDGERVAWVSRACHSVRVNVSTLDRMPGLKRAPRHCGLRLARRPVVRRRIVRLSFSCAGLTENCLGYHTTITTLRTRRRRPSIIGLSFARTGEGGTRVVLTRRGRSLLAHHRRLRVRISTNLGDDDAEGDPRVKPAPRRRVVVTLRR